MPGRLPAWWPLPRASYPPEVPRSGARRGPRRLAAQTRQSPLASDLFDVTQEEGRDHGAGAHQAGQLLGTGSLSVAPIRRDRVFGQGVVEGSFDRHTQGVIVGDSLQDGVGEVLDNPLAQREGALLLSQ